MKPMELTEKEIFIIEGLRQNPLLSKKILNTLESLSGEVSPLKSTQDASTWINEFRKEFLHAPRATQGNKGQCLERMKLLLDKIDVSKKEVLDATRAYVKNCNDKKIFNVDPHYFVIDIRGSTVGSIRKWTLDNSMLYEWILKIKERPVNDDYLEDML